MGEEQLRKKGEFNQIMTVITSSEPVVDSGGGIQGEQSGENNEVNESERETGSSSGLCSIVPVNTATYLGVQPAAGSQNREGTEESRTSTTVPENQQDKSLMTGRMTRQQESITDYNRAQPFCHEDDEEIARRAREEGRVDVTFPGNVTQDACCRFVCELLKCVLYQRQQLPMTYDQMVSFQKQQLSTAQVQEGTFRKPIKSSGDSTWQRCERALRELNEVLDHLEDLFSMSYVPCVLFMLGSSGIVPTELYEINMEALVRGGSDRSLRTSVCLRQLFRTLFVADLLSDVKPVRLMGSTVMALAHRDCGVGWFKPKVNFRIPTRAKRRVISLASGVSESVHRNTNMADLDNYIWFQTPVTIKGFCK